MTAVATKLLGYKSFFQGPKIGLMTSYDVGITPWFPNGNHLGSAIMDFLKPSKTAKLGQKVGKTIQVTLKDVRANLFMSILLTVHAIQVAMSRHVIPAEPVPGSEIVGKRTKRKRGGKPRGGWGETI